jgi:hypothetical protein
VFIGLMRFRVAGDGLREAVPNVPAEFRISVDNRIGDSGDDVELKTKMRAQIIGPASDQLPLDTYLVDELHFFVQYIPRKVGQHTVHVYYDGQLVINQIVPVAHQCAADDNSNLMNFNLSGEGLHNSIISIPSIFYLFTPTSADISKLTTNITDATGKPVSCKISTSPGVLCVEYLACTPSVLSIEIIYLGQLLGKRNVAPDKRNVLPITTSLANSRNPVNTPPHPSPHTTPHTTPLQSNSPTPIAPWSLPRNTQPLTQSYIPRPLPQPQPQHQHQSQSQSPTPPVPYLPDLSTPHSAPTQGLSSSFNQGDGLKNVGSILLNIRREERGERREERGEKRGGEERGGEER